MSAENRIKVEILKPSNYDDTSNVVVQRVDTIAERGLYTNAANLVYEQRLGYITLKPRYRFEEEPPGMWSVYNVFSSYDPITGEDIDIRTDEMSIQSYIYAAHPSSFSTKFSEINGVFQGIAVPPSVGVLRYDNVLNANRPFCILIHCRYMPANRSPVPLPPLRIYWGGATEAMKRYESKIYRHYGLSNPDHPFINSHWAIDITGGVNMDSVYVHVEDRKVEYEDGEPQIVYTSWWKRLATCRIVSKRSISSPFGEKIGLLIEPKPPTAVSITDLYSKNSIQVNAYSLSEVEAARDSGVEYSFWNDGYVSICHTSSIVAYILPVEYEKSGMYISEVIKVREPLTSLPPITYNISTPVLNPGDDHSKPSNRIPGAEPLGTNIDVKLWKADKEEALTQADLENPEGRPITEFRYKVTMTSPPDPVTGYASSTPFLRNVALATLPYIGMEESEYKLDVTKDVTGLRVMRNIDNVRRLAQMSLRNDSGTYNFLLRTHAAPVRIYIDDELFYCGYVEHASERLEGRKTTMNQEEDFKPSDVLPLVGVGVQYLLRNPGEPTTVERAHLRSISLQLVDHWGRLDHCKLAKHLCWNCDWLYHNVAIWNLMRMKAGFPPSKLNMPKEGDQPKILDPADAADMGVVGSSWILTADYTAETPTWVPEMAESLSSFIMRIHEARGGAWWEMFFDEDGSFHYQPKPNRRLIGEDKFTFVESTKEAEGKGGSYLPILGPPVLDVNFDEYRNDIWVAGQLRPWEEVYGTSAPVKDDPVYEYTPIWVNFRMPGSWTVQDPEYMFYVGEKRTALIVNQGIVDLPHAYSLCMWNAYRYGAPRRTYRFRSYFLRGIRPGQWGTMKYKGQEIKVRLRSMEIDFSMRLGGNDYRYTDDEAIGWLCDYEVEVILPWEYF